MTKEEKQRALEAAKLLESPLLEDVLARMDANYIGQWRAADRQEMRERAWVLQHHLLTFKKELFNILQDAALKAENDKQLNAALSAVKEKKNG